MVCEARLDEVARCWGTEPTSGARAPERKSNHTVEKQDEKVVDESKHIHLKRVHEGLFHARVRRLRLTRRNFRTIFAQRRSLPRAMQLLCALDGGGSKGSKVHTVSHRRTTCDDTSPRRKGRCTLAGRRHMTQRRRVQNSGAH